MLRKNEKTVDHVFVRKSSRKILGSEHTVPRFYVPQKKGLEEVLNSLERGLESLKSSKNYDKQKIRQKCKEK